MANLFSYFVNIASCISKTSSENQSEDGFIRNPKIVSHKIIFNLLKPTGHVMHHQFNIQQLYALPTLYLCVLYLSENKQQLVPLTA